MTFINYGHVVYPEISLVQGGIFLIAVGILFGYFGFIK